MITPLEVIVGMGIFFLILWLLLVAVFVTGKLDERRERSGYRWTHRL